MKICAYNITTLNFGVLEFGNDPLDRQSVAEANVNPTQFQFFAYNFKTMKCLPILFAPYFCRILRSTTFCMEVISEKLLENG